MARPKGTVGKNIYIAGLPKTITESQFTEVISEYGKVVQSKLMMDKISGISYIDAVVANLCVPPEHQTSPSLQSRSMT